MFWANALKSFWYCTVIKLYLATLSMVMSPAVGMRTGHLVVAAVKSMPGLSGK